MLQMIVLCQEFVKLDEEIGFFVGLVSDVCSYILMDQEQGHYFLEGMVVEIAELRRRYFCA